MRGILDRLENWMNDYKLKKKLELLYVFCVLIPLILTDGVILYNVILSEREKQLHEMENVASAVQYSLSSAVEHSASAAKSIYMNEYIEEFLNTQYDTALDYVVGYQEFMRNSLFKSSMGIDNAQVTMYADNETIVNGGEFARLSTVRDTKWYQYLQESGRDMLLLFYYDDWKSPAVETKRKILFLRKMNFFGGSPC